MYLCTLIRVRACVYVYCMYARMYMKKLIEHSIRTVATTLLLLVVSGIIYAQQPAGITPEKATRITAPVTLTVQSGSNYIRFDADRLPAVVTYIPLAPFGTIPTALVTGDTIEAEMVFADCGITWRWMIEEGESDQIVQIQAHESATIMAAPHTCDNTSSDTIAVACDSLMWKGEWRYASGDYEYVTTNAAGCDSIVTLHLTINHSVRLNMRGIDVCGSYLWGDTLIETSGTYTRHLQTVNGCDSVVTQTIIVHQAVNLTLPDTAVCELEMEGYEYIWSDPVKGDTTIRHSGTYTRHFQTAFGCDSAVTQTVRFKDITYGPQEGVNVTAYDSYTTNLGVTYRKSISGATDYFVNAAGCDSIVTLNLTIRHLQVIDTFPQTICETELPFVWYGKSYIDAGLHTTDTIHGTVVNDVYMDTVHTVNLTILPVSAGDTMATACEEFEWYGQMYEQSGEYSHTFEGGNIHGCDSTVTLYLTIYHATTGDTTATACDSFEWYGQTYEQSGEYNHTFDGGNIHGCDSIVTLHLTINHANSSEETRTEYESYEWNGVTYTESGNYTFVTKNAAGCDSTATLHLTIKELPTFSYDTVYFCQGYNTEHEELISETQIRRYRKYRYESPVEWAYRDGLVVATQEHRIQLDLRHVEESLEAYYIGELEPIKKISWIYRKDGETALENLTSAAEPIWKDYGYLTIEVRFICGHVFAETIKAGSTEGVEDIDAADTSVRKILKDGQIYILRGNTKYSIVGLKIED